MFKLESYITPLLLSYVDKYIKNLKPEDSQVSLWGGDAVFNNLDLRLDVLEQELQVPFTFVNGHIHELRIHVPWTKLGSEPVVITINTIECVLKLCQSPPPSATETSSASKSSSGLKVRGEPKVVLGGGTAAVLLGPSSTSGSEVEVTTTTMAAAVAPTYVQSLMNRLRNNISVICNNVILKYVEDDIVLSLNVKSLHAVSANELWDESFVADVSLPDLVLRKLIAVHDLTVCLDRRSASGKITVYQDPLLYRCSLDGRLHLAYDARRRLLGSRFDMLCGNLDFSVTDQQLPMFVRLVELCLALHANEIRSPYAVPSTSEDSSVSPDSSPAASGSYDGGREEAEVQQQGWGSWMWSYVPTTLVGWNEEEEEDDEAGGGGSSASTSGVPSPIYRVGMCIHNATFTLKMAEAAGGSFSMQQQKVNFRPLCRFETRGVYLDVILRGLDVFSVQLGVARTRGVVVSGRCTCGVDDLGGEATFFQAGSSEDDDDEAYLNGSLFDAGSAENCQRRLQYDFGWDEHQTAAADARRRAPAFFLDYFYLMEIPDDFSDKSSGLSVSDLEYSNLRERALMSIHLGPMSLDVSASVVHRAQLMLAAATQGDYEPYTKSKEDVAEVCPPPSADEVAALEKFIPSRTMSVVLTRPVVRILFSDHPRVNIPVTKQRNRRVPPPLLETLPAPSLPVLLLSCDDVSLCRTYPMYPRRVVRATCMLRAPPPQLLASCHYDVSVKPSNCHVHLVHHDRRFLLASSECPSLRYRKLLHPSYWTSQAVAHKETSLQVPGASLFLSAPVARVLARFWDSWFARACKPGWVAASDDPSSPGQPVLGVVAGNVSSKVCEAKDVDAISGSLGSLRIHLHTSDGGDLSSPVLSAPEDRGGVHSSTFFEDASGSSVSAAARDPRGCLSFTLQLSRGDCSTSGLNLFFLSTSGVALCLDPRVLRFVSHQPLAAVRFQEKFGGTARLSDDGGRPETSRGGGSVVSSSLPTDAKASSSEGAAAAATSDPGGGGSNAFAESVAAWYPLLSNLVVQVEVDGATVLVSADPVPWQQQRGSEEPVTSRARDLFAKRLLPDTVVLNVPSLHLVNGSKQSREEEVVAARELPVASLEGWTQAVEKFPWNIRVSDYSVLTLEASSSRVCYLLHPGSLSSTVAVTSKVTATPSVHQLSVCVHCDIHQLHLSLSHFQALLVSRLLRDYAAVDAKIRSLLRDDSVPLPVPPAAVPPPPVPRTDEASASVSATATTTSARRSRPPDHDHIVKVSLWMQTTMPKLVVDVTGFEGDVETRLNVELEDLSSSVDIQEVYSKVKLKITAVASTNYSRSSPDDDWLLGPFDGITMCSGDRISKDILVTDPRTGATSECYHGWHDRESSSSSELPRTSRDSFLLLTFTRAQCKNVQKRWAKVLRDCGSDLKSRLQEMYEASTSGDHVRYISEIDAKVMPLDVVLWAPLLAIALDVFRPIVGAVVDSLLEEQRLPVAAQKLDDRKSREAPLFSSIRLPLVYVTCSTVRLFLPNKVVAWRTKVPDVLLLQVGSVFLTPNVDNPLSRLVLKPDVYSVAHKAGILSIPGAELEDRQYQLDVATVSASLGSWDELMQFTRKSVGPLNTMGENPALEWNNKQQRPLDVGPRDVVFCPLVWKFDLRAAAAPAIVYETGRGSDAHECLLVAGHSFELSLTTDIDVYVAFHHLQVLRELLAVNLEVFGATSGCSPTPAAARGTGRAAGGGGGGGGSVLRDSGIESSERSVLPKKKPKKSSSSSSATTRRTSQVAASSAIDLPTSGGGGSGSDPVPFELLLAARCLTLSAYCDEHAVNRKCPKTAASEDDLATSGGNVALAYLLVSQPYVIVKKSAGGSKVELSFYDVVVKGAPLSALPVGRQLPRPDDFVDVCFETLPGDASPKTGIPPALYTLTLTEEEVAGQYSAALRVERPWKLNVSCAQVTEVLECLALLRHCLGGGDDVQNRPWDFRSALARLHSFGYQMGQVVVDFRSSELVDGGPSVHLVLAVGDTSGVVSLGRRGGLTEDAQLDVEFGGCVVQTAAGSNFRTFVGPSTVAANVVATWEEWSGHSVLVPQLMVKCQVDTVFVGLDRKHLECLDVVAEDISSCSRPSSDGGGGSAPGSLLSFWKKLHQEEDVGRPGAQTWQDDLRVGIFQYTQDAVNGDVAPAPNEIIFRKDHDGLPASMTWRYPQPRCLTRIEVHPVPFRAASDVDAAEASAADHEDESSEVRCALQFWDVLRASFETFRVFELSETKHCHLEVPPACLEGCAGKDLVFAHTWRVLMNYDANASTTAALLPKALVSPLALAACMRVDSCFDPEFVPLLECSLDVDLLSVTLSSHVPVPPERLLAPFRLDGTMPEFQEFAVVALENVSGCFRCWRNASMATKAEVRATVVVQLVDYKFLTLQHLLEPFNVRLETFACRQQQVVDTGSSSTEVTVLDSSMRVGPVFFRLSQAAVQTLSWALGAPEVPTATRYVICNGTQEVLRFGQVDTDESVALQPHRAHAYAWRSHKSKQVLHICVEGLRWKWCEPFGIDGDTSATIIRVIRCKNRKATLVIDVRPASSGKKNLRSQLVVTISGQLSVVNRLDCDLELRLNRKSSKRPAPPFGGSADDDDDAATGRIFQAPRTSCPPSFVVQHEDSWSIQVRAVPLPAGDDAAAATTSDRWSTDVDLQQLATSGDCRLLSVETGDPMRPAVSFWCHVFCRKLAGDVAEKRLVAFVPVYVVRSHLPLPLDVHVDTPTAERVATVRVRGLGREEQLFCPGEHRLSFRMVSCTEVSDPPLPLAPDIIERATKLPAADDDRELERILCEDWTETEPILWPYDDDDLQRNVETLPSNFLERLATTESPWTTGDDVAQPNIDLEVSLVQRWPGCNAVLIDVKPWALLVNRSGSDLVFFVGGHDWIVADRSVFALPRITETFRLGIVAGGEVFYSEPMELSAEDWPLNRYHFLDVGDGTTTTRRRILSRDGHATCEILVVPRFLVCRLSLETKRHRGIQVVAVRCHCVVVNETGSDLAVAGFALRNSSGRKVAFDVSTVASRSTSRIFLWDVPEDAPPPTLSTESSLDDFNNYVVFALPPPLEDSAWSLPVRVDLSRGSDRTFAVTVPWRTDEAPRDCPWKAMRISMHRHRSSVYLVVREDDRSQLRLHNNCGSALHFGQSVAAPDATEDVVQDVLLDALPVVGAHSSCLYTFPFVSERFPEIYDPRLMPKLRLAKAGGTRAAVAWSSGVGVHDCGEQFLSIPECGDIKVRVARSMATTDVYLDPVNRVEVSAKEIRSRIRASEGSWVARPKSSAARKPSIDVPEAVVASDARPSSPAALEPSGSPASLCCFGCVHLEHFCLVILDDDDDSEIVRATLDDVVATTRPASSPSSGTASLKQELVVCVRDIQVDNQMFLRGQYDFPVVLVRQEQQQQQPEDEEEEEEQAGAAVPQTSRTFDVTTASLMHLRNDAVLVAFVVVERDSLSWFTHTVELTIKPLAVYVEDQLMYVLMRHFQGYGGAWRAAPPELRTAGSVPDEVVLRANNLGRPVTIQNFVVHPTSLMLSLHASVKLFISLNHSPLSFRAFERRALTTTWYRFGHALTMHYVSGALVRAGWVIGSLDLLANPGGFARAISSGMVDFFRLPYRGLTHGPWAFVVGIVHGSSSLFRHVSSGTVASIADLASSVSRNMDRMSLDRDHLLRNEELRRTKPSGIARGIAQGLTGLGISLLGAVAGIVDQPMQSIQEESSPTSTAAGIISGVGRGLVGIVTKPIGGAAEFVAQAGQGILHGAGWAHVLRPRYDPVAAEDSSSARVNSPLKYVWKMLPDTSLGSHVFTVEATHLNASGHYTAAVLLLTSEALFVVSTDADTQQQAFSLSELDCQAHGIDPTMVYFVSRGSSDVGSSQLEDFGNLDRIAEFIDKSSRYTLSELKGDGGVEVDTCNVDSLPDSSSSSSSSSCRNSQVTSMAMRFFVSPRLRRAFVTHYNLAQRKMLRKGYPL